MAQAAHRLQQHETHERSWPRLVPAPEPKTRTRTNARAKKRSAEAYRSAYRIFVVTISVLAILGMGRVWLSVQAAQASVEADRLRTEIKQEQYVGDMLEIQQSALGSPSRIRDIATQSMGMVPATEVTFLDLPVATTAAQKTDQVPRSGLQKRVASLLDSTAGGAEVLLLGDVGLSSLR